MSRWYASALLLILGACAAPQPQPVVSAAPVDVAQPTTELERPIPYPVEPPPQFVAAIEAGTRTPTGEPGPAYWQNSADYRLRARVIPDAKRLEGSAGIRYHNNSPDPLNALVLELTQNFHAPGAVRMEPAEVTGGVELRRVEVRGRALPPGPGDGPRYEVAGTKLIVFPQDPVGPGESVDLAIDWAFEIPQAGAGERMGWDSDNLFFIAYWYPQMAVYDDVEGWHLDEFVGTTEFYANFGSYSLTVEAPAGWVVSATGRLTNPEEVLAPQVLERLRLAEGSDSVVQVLGPDAFHRATRSADGYLSWTFEADSVRDAAFSLTRESIWDAARTPVGDRDGDGAVDYATVHAFYREPAFRWRNVARYEQHAIDFLSRYTGLSYPWPHMTAVEGAGIIGGGMEFPMMTLMGDYTVAGDSALYYVTAHELAHMWVPMMLSSDERRYSWFDEGITTFNENQARKEFFPGSNPEAPDRQTYLRAATAGIEGEMMRRSAYHYPGPAFVVASYAKPATVLAALRGVLGEETFETAMREFYTRWAWLHPYPWDLWNTVEDVSGRDLDWFWRSWYYETWLLDQAVGSVSTTADGTRITVVDLGNVPMPAPLTITLANGETVRREIPVETWLAGTRTATVTLPAGAEVVRVEIDAANDFPDADRTNNVWTR